MRWISLLVVVACIAGCPAPLPVSPDGPGGNDADSGPPPGASTLRIAWSTDQGIPGAIGNNNRLDEVKFRMENLQAVVTVSPNDPRTTVDELKLKWDNEGSPDAIKFDDAPAGLYTSVVLKLDADVLNHAFSISGHYDISGSDKSFDIESDSSLSISMETNLDLKPGSDMTLMIEVNIADAVNSCNFVQNDDIGDSDSEMVAFRNKLQQSFTVRSQQSAE